ncbi:unnamed protein product [Macrosiphum euphorbiae]|uniref:FLYWCH-type domain-containing protein n=1 Tax=Macrosiphum euphorbiae TaxID=13131 RepID=A0AAV0X020_9HEMI|nr:unnamed protein product [Macrosiphum euphorbiae]
MESSLKIIMSERGKELAVVSSHKYRFIRKRKDELLKWICYNKSCYASILTDVKKTQVFHRTFNAHFYNSHPPIYFVLEALKEMQAETNIKISTIRLYKRIYPKLFHLKICKKLTML